MITGSSGGIGEEFAVQFARRGVNLVLVARRAEKLAELRSNLTGQYPDLTVDVIAADLSVPGSGPDLASKVSDLGRTIDILVNNAGVIKVGPVFMFGEEDWDLIQDVNVKGTFLCSKAVVPHMMQRKSGRIVNLASMAGKSGRGGVSGYCASKFAVIGFTQALAEEMGQFDVTVNAVCPGEVDTFMWREVLLPAIALGTGVTKEEAWEQAAVKNVPLKRPQTVEDIGEAVVFLCKANNITGESINVTGGSEMH